MRMVYSETLIDHFEQPRHVGCFEDTAPDVGTGSVGTPETGGVLQLQIQVRNGLVVDTRFKAYGPPALIAAGSWLAESLAGGSLEQATALGHSAIVAALELPPVRLHCALLAEDAIRAAIQDYKDKQEVYA